MKNVSQKYSHFTNRYTNFLYVYCQLLVGLKLYFKALEKHFWQVDTLVIDISNLYILLL